MPFTLFSYHAGLQLLPEYNRCSPNKMPTIIRLLFEMADKTECMEKAHSEEKKAICS